MPSTASVSQRLLWGRPRDQRHHWLLFVGGYVLVVVGLFVAMLLVRLVPDVGTTLSELVYDPLIPTALFYLPPVVSAASTFRNGGLLASIAVGVAPSLTFGAVMAVGWTARFVVTGRQPLGGDAPLWVLVGFFAGIGVAGALVGYLVGSAGRIAVGSLRSR